MEVLEMDGLGDDMDEEFRQGECVELDLGSDCEAPPSDDEDGMDDESQNQENGVIDEDEIYNDGTPEVDDALACVTHKESVLGVAVCPTDRRIILTGGQDDTAIIWGVEETSAGVKIVERYRLTGHTDSVSHVAFSHDGKFAATASYDGTVRIWTPENGTLLHALEGPSKEVEWISWHPKGHAILAGSADTMAWMWWAPTGKLMQIFAGHAQGVTCGCWGQGGKLVVTGSEDKGIIVWNPRAGTPQQHVRALHEGGIVAICAHPDPDVPIVVSGSEDGSAKVVQIETGKVLHSLTGHEESVEAVGYSNPLPNGPLLLATGSMDGKVIVWDGKTYDRRYIIKDQVEQGGVVRLKWLPQSPYGCWLCTCATDGAVRLFNALSGECVRTLRGHSDTVLDVDVALGEAPAGGEGAQQLLVVSGAEDNTCRLFVVALWTAGNRGAAAPEQAPAPIEVAADQSPVAQVPATPTALEAGLGTFAPPARAAETPAQP